MARFPLALALAGAALMLPACAHKPPPVETVYVPMGYEAGSSAYGAQVLHPPAPVAYVGDTATYVPGDGCAGQAATSSGALMGNISGGTRYGCDQRASYAAPVAQAAPVQSATRTYTRTYTGAPTTYTYVSPPPTTYTYAPPTNTYATAPPAPGVNYSYTITSMQSSGAAMAPQPHSHEHRYCGCMEAVD